jgi:hypothetical protein
VNEGETAKENQSKTHALARLITPYARGIMGFHERTPLWYYEGNRPRCGKDYLAGITQIVYSGYSFEDAPLGKESEETIKRIVSALRAGRRFMHLANCQFHLDDIHLIQAITANVIRARSLGTNDGASDLELPNEIDFSLSANVGLTRREDVSGRMRKIDLAYFGEDENSRTFAKTDLHGWVKENRGLILSAIKTLVDHWIGQGMKPGKTPFTSFPRWAEVVGGIITACGLGDPCQPQAGDELFSGDKKTQAMKALYQVIKDTDQLGLQFLKQNIYEIIAFEVAEGNDALSWFGDLNAENGKEKLVATMKVGKTLVAFHDREFGGIKMVVDKPSSNAARWTYKWVPVG